MGEGTRFAYGGLGVLIHKDSKIGKYCTIGTNATLATSPELGNFVYVATGAKLIKNNLKIGDFCIIGANAVVTEDVPPFSIVGGIPSKVIKTITPETINKYLTGYFASAKKTDPDFVKSVYQEFMTAYKAYKHL